MNRRSISRKVVASVIVVILFAGCNETGPAGAEVTDSIPWNANYIPQAYKELGLRELPNMASNVEAALTYYEPLDADSIEMFEYRGDTCYHPVNLCHRCFVFLGTYFATGEDIYLDRCKKNVNKLRSMRVAVGAASYVPYGFDFAVHADSANTFRAPWFSGMAQGELLSVVTRLYELTSDPEYLDFAQEVFNSLVEPVGPRPIWVTRLDSLGYYWIEEYPHNDCPGQTLNGFIAALFGVYDYYRVTESGDARRVWDISLTTLKHYLPYFRREGQTSLYCLGHSVSATEGYHDFHIRLIRDLYRMTGDPYFEAMADVFESDS